MTRSLYLVLLMVSFAGLFSPQAAVGDPIQVKAITVVLDDNASAQARLCGELLIDRITRRSQVETQTIASNKPVTTQLDHLTLYLGKAGDPLLTQVAESIGFRLPDISSPGPEGFALKAGTIENHPVVLAVGVDQLGTLYVVGEILRRLNYQKDSIAIDPCKLHSAPAYRWRGSSANQGGTMRQMSDARTWTREESHDADLDHALAGSNTIYAYGEDVAWAKGYGLKVTQGCRPNQLPDRPIPPEWKRKGTEEGEYVCPSVPEARKALIEYYTKDFAKYGETDVLRFFAGDPGGCRCDLCQPWGKTFIELCAELAPIWKRFHPNCEIQIANQDVDNAGDEAIFTHLNEKPHSWLNSICYGPGSNAMSDYFRPELRKELFTYPAHGPLNRYLAFTLQNLPKDVSIVHYSDVSHWISAQYQVTHPERHLTLIYGRRTFHQRPQAFYHIFNSIMPFSEGDILYSEGYHDELHQYLWNRMLWNPNRSLDDLMLEYATYHFGSEAAPEMVQASYQLEKNLEEPLESNPGIDRYYGLVKSAGGKIPSNLLEKDHRWRLHMQKGALDKYFQHKLRRELDLVACASDLLGDKSRSLETALTEGLAILGQPFETQEMIRLREEAGKFADESDRLFGIRNEGIKRTDLDLTGINWFKRQMENAVSVPTSEEKKQIVEAALHYEDPGEGGYYDDAGEDGRQPHRIEGENLWNPAQFSHLLDPSNRPSASSFCHNRTGPVRFAYTSLDPTATYKLRVTLVTLKLTPELLARFGVQEDQVERHEDILADQVVLAKDIEVPAYTAKQYEFRVPQETTRDGNLEIRFDAHPAEGKFAASIVSEVWLMKEK